MEEKKRQTTTAGKGREFDNVSISSVQVNVKEHELLRKLHYHCKTIKKHS